MTHICTAAP